MGNAVKGERIVKGVFNTREQAESQADYIRPRCGNGKRGNGYSVRVFQRTVKAGGAHVDVFVVVVKCPAGASNA